MTNGKDEAGIGANTLIDMTISDHTTAGLDHGATEVLTTTNRVAAMEMPKGTYEEL